MERNCSKSLMPALRMVNPCMLICRSNWTPTKTCKWVWHHRLSKTCTWIWNGLKMFPGETQKTFSQSSLQIYEALHLLWWNMFCRKNMQESQPMGACLSGDSGRHKGSGRNGQTCNEQGQHPKGVQSQGRWLGTCGDDARSDCLSRLSANEAFQVKDTAVSRCEETHHIDVSW